MRNAGLMAAAGIAVLAMTGVALGQTPAERGTKVFAEQKCSLCHSVAGKGNAKGPLDDVGARLKVEDIRKWITAPAEMAAAAKAERKPAMKAYPNLPKADLDALVGYLASLKSK